MKESHTPNSFESLVNQAKRNEREYKEKYKKLPAAEPRLFPSVETINGEISESPFVFPPINMRVNEEAIASLIETKLFSEFELKDVNLERHLLKLRDDESLFGNFEVTFCMRAEGNSGRIDKMIAEIDPDNPWQPGKIEHLLMLAVSHPESFDSPVLALGTEVKQTGMISRLQNKNGRTEYSEQPSAAGIGNNNRILIVRRV